MELSTNIRLGGPILERLDDPSELVAAHVAAGYRAALIPYSWNEDDDLLRAARAAFTKADVMFAEAGAWCNLVSPDDAVRARNFEYVCRRLSLADALGACCCVDYLGTLDPDSDFGPHPANLALETFDLAVEVIRQVIDAVRPRRAKFALEMMQWLIPDSVACYKQLIAAVDRPAFGVHVDPVNLILTPRQYFDTGTLLREIFRELGPHIVSCHAKDITLHNRLALHFDEVAPGQGNLDYGVYLQEIGRLNREVPLMLEHLGTHEEYMAARAFILSKLPAKLSSPV
jgi:sugar phosphate isomerase/epimerase